MVTSVTENEPPTTGTDGGGFVWLANALCLDLVNTEAVADGQRVDLLATPDDFNRWCKAAKFAPPTWLATVFQRASAAAATEMLAEVKQLRSAIRRIAEATSAKRVPAPEALQVVNAALAARPGAAALAWRHGRLQREWTLTDDSSAQLLGELAAAAAEFFAAADPARLHACAGEGCLLWFYDTSRNGQRRWCSMAACGNRDKVRRFRAESG